MVTRAAEWDDPTPSHSKILWDGMGWEESFEVWDGMGWDQEFEWDGNGMG